MSDTTNGFSTTVGTTAVLIVPAVVGARRIFSSFKNNSTGGQIITLLPADNSAVVAGAGIPLNPGQGIIDSDSEGYEAWQGGWQAIADAAGGALSTTLRVKI